MERRIEIDQNYKKVLPIVQILYVLSGLVISVLGIVHHSAYEAIQGAATLLLLPGLYLVRRLFRWDGGWQLETYIYLFTYLGWSLGGAAQFYGRIPYFDKVVHCLSGVFVATLALAFYRMLERGHSRQGENPATACFFVFFASMAVAGMFELCEYALAPIMGRDLQHVLDTGVSDTMGDMFVCLIGTLVVVGLMIRSYRGKPVSIIDAAEVFAQQNTVPSSTARR